GGAGAGFIPATEGNADLRRRWLRKEAGEQARRPARRERHHDGDRPLRPGLLRVRRCRQRKDGGYRKGCENSAHANPPMAEGFSHLIGLGMTLLLSSPRTRAQQMYAAVNRDSHRLEVGIAALVEVLVGVAHGLGLAASEHDLQVGRVEAVVLIAMDDAGGTRDAFPRPEAGGEALAALVLDEDVEVALEHEETLFDLVGVGGIALSRLHIHDRQGEVLRRDDARIAVLAGTARADEAMLCALVALDLGVLERRLIRLLLAAASDIFLQDVLDRKIDHDGPPRMPCNAHGSLLSNGIIGIESIPALRGQSMKRPCACDPEGDVTCVPSVRA